MQKASTNGAPKSSHNQVNIPKSPPFGQRQRLGYCSVSTKPLSQTSTQGLYESLYKLPTLSPGGNALPDVLPRTGRTKVRSFTCIYDLSYRHLIQLSIALDQKQSSSLGDLPPGRSKCPTTPLFSMLCLFLEFPVSILHHPVHELLSRPSSSPFHPSFHYLPLQRVASQKQQWCLR